MKIFCLLLMGTTYLMLIWLLYVVFLTTGLYYNSLRIKYVYVNHYHIIKIIYVMKIHISANFIEISLWLKLFKVICTSDLDFANSTK